MCVISAAIEASIIARGTVGFSGADLENLVNQAALKAAVDGKDMVTMKELEFAKDKILMGACKVLVTTFLSFCNSNLTLYLSILCCLYVFIYHGKRLV